MYIYIYTVRIYIYIIYIYICTVHIHIHIHVLYIYIYMYCTYIYILYIYKYIVIYTYILYIYIYIYCTYIYTVYIYIFKYVQYIYICTVHIYIYIDHEFHSQIPGVAWIEKVNLQDSQGPQQKLFRGSTVLFHNQWCFSCAKQGTADLVLHPSSVHNFIHFIELAFFWWFAPVCTKSIMHLPSGNLTQLLKMTQSK